MKVVGTTLCALFLSSMLLDAVYADKDSNKSVASVHRPMSMIGERLTYSISWSKILEAGRAVLEVRDDKTDSGRPAYRIISTAKTVGIVKTFYYVSDVVQSLVAVDGLYSLSYEMDQKHGKRKRHRVIRFDHENLTAQVTGDGGVKAYPIPQHVHDPLSSLYYVRMLDRLKDGETVIIDVFDKDKTWSVDIQVLGRERIKTPLGEFDTVKLRTYPKYEGVFQHKGEIFIWLTDDERKIPVLMKSTVAIGSIVATITDIKLGDDTR